MTWGRSDWGQSIDDRDIERIRREAEYAQREAEEQRERAERLERERENERRQREQERRERYEELRHIASSWPDALRKQAGLYQREANLFSDGDTWFSDGAAACRRALEIWSAVDSDTSAQIAELERQIAALRTHQRYSVGVQLATEANGRGGWQDVANTLSGDEYDDPSDWLNW